MPKKRLTPLPRAAFQILLALVGQDLHGYGIMRQVEEQTSGQVRLGAGTLYSSIQTLLEEGFITECEQPKTAGPNSERRRYYHLSPSGKRLAQAEASRLAELLKTARRKNILRGDYV